MAGVSIFGTEATVTRLLVLPAPTIIGARGLVVSFLLVAIHLLRGRSLRLESSRLLVVGIGLCFAGDYLLFTAGIQRAAVATVVTLMYLYPVFTALLAGLFLGERVQTRTGLALLIGLLGIGVISYPMWVSSGTVEMQAIAMGLGVAGFVAVERTLVKKLDPALSSLTVNTYKYTMIALLFFPGLVGGLDQIAGSTLVLVLISALMSGVIAGTLLLSGVRRVRAIEGAALGYFEPVVAIGLAWLVVGEAPTANALVGGAIIFLSSYLVLKETAPSLTTA